MAEEIKMLSVICSGIMTQDSTSILDIITEIISSSRIIKYENSQINESDWDINYKYFTDQDNRQVVGH